MITRSILAATLALAALSVAAAPGSAGEFSHAGGFVCGSFGATNNRLLAGEHRTIFNIRNPNTRVVTVNLELALTFPAADPAPAGASFTPGATVTLRSVALLSREAVMIDCDELLAAAAEVDENLPPYISGTLEARAQRALQVTRIESAGPNGEDVSSIAVSEIEPRAVDEDDD